MKRSDVFRCGALAALVAAASIAGCDQKKAGEAEVATSVSADVGAENLGENDVGGTAQIEEDPQLPGVRYPDEETPGKQVLAFELASVEVSGGAYSRAIVERNLGRQEDFVRECYREQLQDTPGVGGAMTATFDIAPNGRVSELEVTSEALPEKMFGCVREQVERARFPTPREPVSVLATYELSATDADETR